MDKASIYIQVKSKSYGPFTASELEQHIRDGKIPFAAWVFNEGRWVLLAEDHAWRERHPEFSPMPQSPPQTRRSAKAVGNIVDLVRAAPLAAQSPETASLSAEQVWFVIRDKKKFGPYGAAELISQLQRKQLEPTAFVWRPGFATWQKVSQVSEFSRDAMKRLAADGKNVDVIVKRRHARQPYEVDVIAHDNTRAIEGRTMMIGEGGLFLATFKPSHRVGARLKLHFREGDAPAFNAVAEVVSVVRGDTPGYCMRFVAISDSDRRRISKLVSTKER